MHVTPSGSPRGSPGIDSAPRIDSSALACERHVDSDESNDGVFDYFTHVKHSQKKMLQPKLKKQLVLAASER